MVVRSKITGSKTAVGRRTSRVIPGRVTTGEWEDLRSPILGEKERRTGGLRVALRAEKEKEAGILKKKFANE